MNAFFEHHKHPVRLSMLRSDSAERIDPAFPTTRARAGFLQYLPGEEKGHEADFNRDRRSVPILAAEPQ
jgi:hypothetical protein